MADWRAMNSLLVLRDQVNTIAPARSKASDGLVGDPAHQAGISDHNPHPVAGVGPAMVSALDLTHDPAHGFDSYAFAETLRVHRDPRIKYVISNRRIFDSSGSDAWTWRPYIATSDPHTGHVHISVLDAVISDTKTPWNLEGFAMADYTVEQMRAFAWQYDGNGIGENNGTTVKKSTLAYFDQVLDNSRAVITDVEQVNTKVDQVDTKVDQVRGQLVILENKLDQILALLAQGGGGTFPAVSTFSANGIVTWNPQ